MIKLVNKLLSLTWVGDLADAINGSKTVIGLITLAIYVLQIVPIVFPDIGLPADLADKIHQALLYIGVTLVPVGLAHKGVKAIDK